MHILYVYIYIYIYIHVCVYIVHIHVSNSNPCIHVYVYVHMHVCIFVDVDECNETMSCDEETTVCNNVYGDYECICKDGYVRDVADSPKDSCEGF